MAAIVVPGLLIAWVLLVTAPPPEATAFFSPPPRPTGTVRRALLWLGWGNALLGFVNLLPGYPLDGGVLLHRAVERRADPRRALRVVGGLGMMVSALTWVVLAASLVAGVPLLLPPDWRPNREAWRAASRAVRPTQ